MQFTTAAAQSVAIQRCLQEARVNASRPAASAATLARTALLAGNATAAAAAIQSALCSTNTALATAEAYAQVIGSSVGCNSTVQNSLQCEPCLYRLHASCMGCQIIQQAVVICQQCIQMHMLLVVTYQTALSHAIVSNVTSVCKSGQATASQ